MVEPGSDPRAGLCARTPTRPRRSATV